MDQVFQDRSEAGRLLARELAAYAGRRDVLVLGLPRGGVPVAFEVARALGVPLDVFIVRKLGVPGHREYAMGAIASGGIRVLNESVVRQLGIRPEAVAAVVAEEERELHRRERAYRGHGAAQPVAGKTVILVDDGIATGSTVRAAIRGLRRLHPARLVLAVPTAAASTADELRPEVDEWVALSTPEDFEAVGRWYEDFSPTEDAEVTALLERAKERG